VRKLLIPLVLVLCMVLSGCSGNPLSQLPWAVNIYSYDLESQVETDWNPKLPAPGYQWLLLEVTVSNKTSKTEMLNSFIYEFELVLSGNHYVNQLVWDSPVGGLEWARYLQPGQTLNGDLFFEVPLSVTGLAGVRLIMRDTICGYASGCDISTVPRR
jgi:hypothetical protein